MTWFSIHSKEHQSQHLAALPCSLVAKHWEHLLPVPSTLAIVS